MKILFLVSSLNAGGAERVACTLASAWAERGDEVTLLATYPGKGQCFYPLAAGVDLQWMADRIGATRNPLMVTLRKLRALREQVRRQRPDVVISFLTNVNVMALIATRGLGAPIIVCERSNPAFSTSSGGVLKALRRWTYPWAQVVTVQTEASVEPFRRMVPGIRALRVVPNPLPPALMDAARPAGARAAGGRRSLMAMGRLVPAKQFSLLIRAFARLAPGHAEWDLTIWGDGPQREALVRQAAEAGLTDRISLPGRSDAPWEELGRADAFALTSAVEGFPNVLLEAMALGLPCIVFDCPSGPAEMTRGGEDALLIPAGDEQALVEGLERLLADEMLRARLGAQAAQSVRRRYALPAVLAQWDDLMALARAARPAAPGQGDS